MDSRQSLLLALEKSGSEALALMLSLDESQLDVKAAEGEWTPRYITHHVADAEIVNAGRLRRLLSESEPHLGTFDPALLADSLAYYRAVASSILLFEAIHLANLDLIQSVANDDWERTATHEELGTYSLEVWIARRIDHQEGHVAQIRNTIGVS